MKHWAVLIFFLMFCVSCTCNRGAIEATKDPGCEEFNNEADQICKDLGNEDKRCMTEWKKAHYKCQDKTAPDQCRGFYDKAKQFCKNQTGNEFGSEEAKCGKKLTEANHKCKDAQKSRGFFQTLICGPFL